MDRPVGPTAPLSPAAHLLSRSEVEPGAPSQGLAESVAALTWLGQLERVTIASITPSAAQKTKSPAEQNPAPEARTPTPAAAAPRADRKVSTSRPEYKPALRDRQLVEALLRLEKSSGLRPTPPAADAETEKFSATQAPEVRAVPKPATFRRSAGPCQTVLRPTDESS